MNTESQIAEAFVYCSAGLFGFISSTTILADSTGNNGQCRQLQKTFPPELQDFEGVHDTFTGPGHNEPPPLPFGP
jgi:hypothetical protein